MESVLPGQIILIPTPTKSTAILKLGPGLSHGHSPMFSTSHSLGTLITDPRRNALYLENNMRRYNPRAQDSVIAMVLRSTPDAYTCAIQSSTLPAPSSVMATLPHYAFPRATKKTRPILHPGDLVYARVSIASKHFDPELECFDAETGKAAGFGLLKGGMVFGVSLGTARRLLGDGKKIKQATIKAGGGWKGGNGSEVLEEMGRELAYEVAVGRNGRVWVESENLKTTVLIGKCLVQSEGLTSDEVREMVRKELKHKQPIS